jgi:hypothetical protein
MPVLMRLRNFIATNSTKAVASDVRSIGLLNSIGLTRPPVDFVKQITAGNSKRVQQPEAFDPASCPGVSFRSYRSQTARMTAAVAQRINAQILRPQISI